MIIIDKDRAIELLKQAVAIKGTLHTVTSCQYVETDRTGSRHSGCIVGTALYNVVGDRLFHEITDDLMLGVSRTYHANTRKILDHNFQKFIKENLDVSLTPEAIEVWHKAQQIQDGQGLSSDRSWGHALEVALTV